MPYGPCRGACDVLSFHLGGVFRFGARLCKQMVGAYVSETEDLSVSNDIMSLMMIQKQLTVIDVKYFQILPCDAQRGKKTLMPYANSKSK